MVKKLETLQLIASMDKAYKKTSKAVWRDLMKRMQSSRRIKTEVNLEKISKIAEKNKGKIIVVPGKVLSQGELTVKTVIVFETASESAKRKIKEKGEFITLKEFIANAQKIKASDILIVG